jgi:hypothetical protein
MSAYGRFDHVMTLAFDLGLLDERVIEQAKEAAGY